MFFWPGAGLYPALMRMSPSVAGEMAGENVYLHLPRYPADCPAVYDHYGLPQFGIEPDPIPAGDDHLSLNTAAYAAETLRRRSPDFDKLGRKRRLGIGMTPWQNLRRAILPQVAARVCAAAALQ